MHLLLSVGVAAAAANFTVSSVFRAGESGYAAFRIPGIVAAGEVLVAVAEGRKYGCDDFAGAACPPPSRPPPHVATTAASQSSLAASQSSAPVLEQGSTTSSRSEAQMAA